MNDSDIAARAHAAQVLITPAAMTAGGQARYRLSELREQVREIYHSQRNYA